MASATINFGADGPFGGTAAAGTSYALTIAAGGASGVTTTEGEAITLVQLGNGSVLGVVQGSGEHVGDGGFCHLDQRVDRQRSISINISEASHPVNPNPNDPLHLGAGSLSVVVTGTDLDGDKASSSARSDISSHVTFLDDSPTAVAALAVTSGLDDRRRQQHYHSNARQRRWQ